MAQAAIAAAIAAGGSADDVVVVGQSLGGGLAGIVSSFLGIKGYAIAPAPFDRHFEVLASNIVAAQHGVPPEDMFFLMDGNTTEFLGRNPGLNVEFLHAQVLDQTLDIGLRSYTRLLPGLLDA